MKFLSELLMKECDQNRKESDRKGSLKIATCIDVELSNAARQIKLERTRTHLIQQGRSLEYLRSFWIQVSTEDQDLKFYRCSYHYWAWLLALLLQNQVQATLCSWY